MALPSNPAPALTFGRESGFYVPSGGFSNYLAPTAAELVAVSVLDFTLIAMADGTARPSQSVNRLTAARRLGSTTQYERKGVRSIQGGTLTYQIQPQAAGASAGKKAFEKFLGGPSGGFIVQRFDIDISVVPTTGQFVKVWPADLSESIIQPSADDESGEVVGQCDYFLTNVESALVALA